MADSLWPDAGARLARALASCIAGQNEAVRTHPDLAACDQQAVQRALRGDLPDAVALRSLAQALALGDAEHAAALLALRAETDARLVCLLELLQGSEHAPGPARPTLALLAALMVPVEGSEPQPAAQERDAIRTEAGTMAQIAQGPALACGLLQLSESGPLARRTVALPLPLVTLLASGAMPPVARLHRLLVRQLPAPGWALPASWKAPLQAAPARPPAQLVVVLRGSDAMSDLEAAAHALAAGWQLQAVRVEADEGELTAQLLQAHATRAGLAPYLVAAGAAAVWQAPAAPGQAVRVLALEGFTRPWIVLAGADVTVQADPAVTVVEIDLPLPGPQERLVLWHALVPGGASDTAAPANLDAVRDSRCGLSVLLRAARAAGSSSADAATALNAAVRGAARELAAWAQVSTDHVPLDTWVGQEEIRVALDLLLARCAAREDAARGLGPLLAGRVPSGVKALFVGASGTGKTLAAQWMADRLARPLVRVDLGAVVSKYIGETEKNLGALLARAEHVDAVLLFDEADSLFGARTDVRQANDRYANMQTNYLLQRLETFRGLAILTSNSLARFDDAFIRRLDTTIEFPLPDAEQRLRLWDLHLGVRGDEPLPLQALRRRVAALADLPGGHIRNAALTAALLARARAGKAAAVVAADADRNMDRDRDLGGDVDVDADGTAPPAPVIAADLSQALVLEYRKLGLRLPEALLQQD